MIRHVKFTGLPVTDQDRALAFYAEKLGMKVVQDAPYKEGWRWIELEIPGAATRLMFTERSDNTQTDVPQLVLVMDDVDATHRELAGKGVEFIQEPTKAPWNPGKRFAQFCDSEGTGTGIVIGTD